MKKILSFIVVILPWRLKRILLIKIWKYEIHSSARIGLSYIYPSFLKMGINSRISHFTVAIHLDSIEIGDQSKIGRSNWITGFPSKTNSRHFKHQSDRQSALVIGNHSAITKKHHIDCTNIIKIGNFVTIAGYNSQFLTHSIDVYENRQDSKPIFIGDYCFVSTGVMVLGGSTLPSFSVLAAGAILNKVFVEEWKIYAGVPAVSIKHISDDAKYFSRERGFVY
jgi:acetyltransferase-like isoleucine patch superfamily enzyme